ncbi:MAG: TIM barrel protein [Patescibacteria group bacterium]|nr:TIM barrel protein [Patescibacteria group bacterium]
MQATTRRGFLKHSMAAAAALSAGPLATSVARAAAKPGQHIQLGLVTYMWGADWDLPTLIANCERANIAGVEPRTTHRHGIEPSLNAAERAEVKKRFADSPVTLVGPGSNERFDNPDPDALKQAIETTKAFVKLSHDVGGTGVKVKPDSLHKGIEPDVTLAQIAKALNEVGRFAGDYGQQIRLETHGSCAAPAIIKKIMDQVTDPNVAVCWNSNPIDLKDEGFEHNFNLLKDRLGATAHIRELDWPGYPWQRLIDLMVAMDYRGYLLLECTTKHEDYVAAMAAQAKLLPEMIARANA